MPEPLRLDVELGAQGVAAGIGQISKETDGLKVSSQKASAAIKGFAYDISNAKDGADVASAALGAFTRILGSSIAATVFAAGAKAVYDAYNEITGAVDKAKKSLEAAFEVARQGGLAESFAEGVGQAKEFDKVADSIRKKIAEINNSPLQNLIDGLTGSTMEMERTAKLAEEEANRRRENAALAELEYQKKIQGATNEQKALLEIDKELKNQLDSINVLTEAKTASALVAIANLKKEAIERKTADEEMAKSQKNLESVIKERVDNEVKAYDAMARAKQEAIKIEQNFEAERAKAHKAELERTAERIGAIQEEIKGLQERGSQIRESLTQAGGGLATSALTRGGGQRPTSAQVGAERKAQEGIREAERETKAAMEAEARKRITERGGKADGHAVQRELQTMAKEGAKAQALGPLKQFQELQKQLDKNTKAEADKNKELTDANKAQSELNSIVNESSATFDGADYSVHKLTDSADASKEMFDFLAPSADRTRGSLDGLGSAAGLLESSLSSLGSEASSGAGFLSNFSDSLGLAEVATEGFIDALKGLEEIESINTKKIVLNA